MELHDAKELLPLYAANTLTPGERAAVDTALQGSKELNDELAFWRKAQLTAHAHAEFLRENHLPSEQIVDYAERTVVDSSRRSRIEAHLQACRNCREEYDMILQTIPARETQREITPNFLEKIRGFVASFKPVYVLPAIAIVVGVVALWRGFETKSFDDNTARFIIPFQGQMRSDESLPSVALSPSAKRIELTLCLPHDSLVATQYKASLTTPAGAAIPLAETFSKIIAHQSDSIKVTLSTEALRVEGEYTLSIAEVPSSLPPGASPFPPEPYRFRVTRNQAK